MPGSVDREAKRSAGYRAKAKEAKGRAYHARAQKLLWEIEERVWLCKAEAWTDKADEIDGARKGAPDGAPEGTEGTGESPESDKDSED